MNQSCKLKGRAKVEVLNPDGSVALSREWQPNLLLDQGLNHLSDVVLCDLFLYAVKGNSAQAMKEVVTGTYTLNVGAATLTRNTGTRDFTSDDEGKTVRSAGGVECVIVSVGVTPNIADVRQVGNVGLTAFSTSAITLYSTQLQGMDSEDSRTNSYSSVAGENGTTSAGASRTFKRTFVFAPEASNEEFIDPGTTAATWAGTTVTRTGSRNFTSADLGKYVYFIGTADFAKITSITSSSVVVVDRTPPHTNTAVQFSLFGYNSYSHIGFSDSEEVGDTLNILLRLEASGTPTPVLALGANPETGGQQVKVTYSLTATFGPSTTGAAGGTFSDPSGAMGGSTKAGQAVLEAISSSIVLADGSTDTTSVALEPSQGGSVALSTSSAALVPVTPVSVPPDRSPGAAVVPLNQQAYTLNSFTCLYVGDFGVNEGNGINWRTLGVYDDAINSFIFTYLFSAAQKKPGTHQFRVTFRKTWGRDLS